jgi:radical SAM superfamily enzyme YgiQ (UPF0313 family)
MKTHGDIVLIACYELGHQPLSLALPLAFLRRSGFGPVAVDTSVESLSDATIQAAKLVAIAVPMHTATRLGVQIAERVRRLNPTAAIAFCGLYAHLNAELLVPAKGDFVLSGEYEAELVALAEHLGAESGKQKAETTIHPISSLLIPLREEQLPSASRFSLSASQPTLAKLDFPTPDRTTLPTLDNYAHFRIGELLMQAGHVEASRGCLHTCSHCPITPVYEGRFFIVPRDVVLADIRAQVAAGAEHITFGDPDFLNGPRHSLAILREMHREFPHLTFDATIKIEHILQHREIFPELRELGCAFIVSAVESFSDPVLAELEKGHTVTDIGEAFRITRAAGIVLRPSFVAFTPWTTPQDYVEMMRQVEQYGMIEQVDPVQYTIRLLIPPHSAILTDANRNAGWLGELDASAFTYRWAHPNPRMDEFHQAVAALVEEAVAREDSTATIFHAIKALAYRYAEIPLPTNPIEILLSAPDVVPGLTESWFCCAEPTAMQVKSLDTPACGCCTPTSTLSLESVPIATPLH